MKKAVIAIVVIAVLTALISFIVKRREAIAGTQYAKKYISENGCAKCHKDQAKKHEKTAHAKSFNSLVDIGEQENPKCLPCHTTGYKKPGGFADLKTTKEMAGVGCQACHGPGSEHVKLGLSKEERRKNIQRISNEACASCHKIHKEHIDYKKGD